MTHQEWLVLEPVFRAAYARVSQHDWTIHVRDANGAPVLVVRKDGFEHGHAWFRKPSSTTTDEARRVLAAVRKAWREQRKGS